MTLNGVVFMLIDEIIDYSDNLYSNYICNECHHPSGGCSGSCYNCLYQIHYPDRTIGLKKAVYDCPKMILHYVCQYLHLYASEVLYAFNTHKDFLSQYEKYHIMSIACGAAPDLMALEYFCNINNINKKISYKGYDINPLWNTIHSYIKKYCRTHNINRSFYEKDVISYFNKYYVPGTNIIIISYLISYLYNTKQISQIDLLFEQLADNVVLRKDKNDRMFIGLRT